MTGEIPVNTGMLYLILFIAKGNPLPLQEPVRRLEILLMFDLAGLIKDLFMRQVGENFNLASGKEFQ